MIQYCLLGGNENLSLGTRIQIYIEWIVLLTFFILLPGWYLEKTLQSNEIGFRKYFEGKRSQKAFENLARLEQSLDVRLILRNFLAGFRKFALKKLGNASLNSEKAKFLDARFRRNFPRSSLVFWFDEKNRFITQADLFPKGQSKRIWQNIFDAINDPENRAFEERANGAVKFLMGQLATIQLVRKSEKEPIKVFFGGETHFITLIRFRSPERKYLGGFLAAIPADRAKPGWELEYAIRKVRRESGGEEIQLGGRCNSNEVTASTELLSPGLIRGLSGESRKERSGYFYQGFYYWGKSYVKNPDLYLLVGVREQSGEKLFLWCFRFMIWVGRLGMLVASIYLVLIYFDFVPFLATLQTKFRLTSLILSGIPLLVLFVLVATFALKTKEIGEEQINRHLDSILVQFEQEMGNQLSEIGQTISDTFAKADFSPNSISKSLDNILKEYSDTWGLKNLLFIPSDRDFETRGRNVNQRLTNIYVQIVWERFKFGKPELSKKFKKDSTANFFVNAVTPQNFLLGAGKFQPFITGDRGLYVFYNFIYNSEGKKTGFYSLFFRYEMFRNFLIQRCREKILRCFGIPEKNLYVRPLSFGKVSSKISENRYFKSLLDLVETTGEPLRTEIQSGRRSFKVLARPIMGLNSLQLNSLAVIAKSSRKTFESFPFIAAMFFFLTLLGIIGSKITSDLLFRSFLVPVKTLEEAIIEVDKGNYAVTVVSQSQDELGKLAESFNSMVDGLRQKERMTYFLRKELVEDAGKSLKQRIVREHAAVLFAGIRDFSELEVTLSPRAAMAIMVHFLGTCEEIVKKHGGEIDKFIGDTAMAVFRKTTEPLAERRSLLAAVEIRDSLKNWLKEREALKLPCFSFGIGISCGEVLAGHIGSFRKRLDYTVIGDTVNLAARLEKSAGRPGRQHILASGQVQKAAGDGIPLQLTDITSVRGRSGAVQVFEVLENVR